MAEFKDVTARNAAPKKGQSKTIDAAGDGLYLETSARGTKTWKHRYKVANGYRWHKIGAFPSVSLKEARKLNAELKTRTDKGRPPDDPDTPINRDSTVSELFEMWFSLGRGPAEKKSRPWSPAYKRNVQYMFQKDILTGKHALGDMPIKFVDATDIRKLLRAKEKTAPNQALQLYRRLNRLFSFAVSEGIISASPMAAVTAIGEEKTKNRSLSPAEIKTFLAALPTSYMEDNTKRILEIILRTGQRPSEVAGARQAEITGDVWTIPAERTKNRREHLVFLTEKVKELFGEANEHGLFFPSRNPAEPLKHTAISKAVRRSLTGAETSHAETFKRIDIEKFTPHDLRRTANTLLARCGFPTAVRCALLNQTLRNINDETYNSWEYSDEKRQAVQELDNIITIVTSPEPVAALVYKWRFDRATLDKQQRYIRLWNDANGGTLSSTELDAVLAAREQKQDTGNRKIINFPR